MCIEMVMGGQFGMVNSRIPQLIAGERGDYAGWMAEVLRWLCLVVSLGFLLSQAPKKTRQSVEPIISTTRSPSWSRKVLEPSRVVVLLIT